MSVIQLTMEAADKGMAEQWFGLWAALLGAVIGAFAAGGVTYVLNRLTRRETLKTTCIHLTLKLGRISSSMTSAYKQIKEGIAEAEAGGVTGDLWNKMLPLTGMEKIHILPEELAVFVHMRDYEFINQVTRLDDRHNGVVDALTVYARKREALTDMLPAVMQGQAGTVTITDPEVYATIAPKIAEVKMLAESVLADLHSCAAEAQKSAADVGPRLRKYFKDKKFPVLSIPENLKIEPPPPDPT